MTIPIDEYKVHSGVAFTCVVPGGHETSLFVVLSDPESPSDEVFAAKVVPCQKWEDPACIIEPGEHPGILKRMFVDYADSIVAPAGSIRFLLHNHDEVRQHAIVPPDLIERMRSGAATSIHCPPDFLEVIKGSGS